MIIQLGLVLALTVGAPQQAAEPRAPDSAAANDHLFSVGERLSYEVRWGFVALGRAEMRVMGIDTIRGTPAAHIQFHIQGGNYFYSMDDRMDSWIALADTSSRRFSQDFVERKKERHAYYDIVPDSGYYRERGVDSLQPTVPRPLDDAAFFYFVRTLALDPGKRYEFPRYFRPDRNPVILDVKSRDTVNVPAGKFPSLVVQPIIKGKGILAEASEARMWLSDDDRHLMVQLKSKFPVIGVITLRLIRVEKTEPLDRPAPG